MNVKSVLNNVVETAEIAAQIAATKSKQIYSIAKARIAITAETDKIQKAEMALGKLYYKDYVAGVEANPEEYRPWCDKITEAKAQIAQLNARIEELKQMQIVVSKKEDADEEVEVEIYEVDPPVEVADAPTEETPAEESQAEDAPAEEAPAGTEEPAE